jgi:signal transduction histidine kinase
MKKIYIFIVLLFITQFVFAEGKCNDDFLKDLPLPIKELLEKASAASKDDVKKAIEIISQAVLLVESDKSYTITQKYDLLQKIEKTAGVIYEEDNQLDRAKERYLQELAYVELSGNIEAKMGVYIDLAIVEKRKGNFREAKENYIKSLELAEKEKNLKLQDFAYYGLGTLYEASGEYEKAVGSYIKSLKLADQRNSVSDAINTMQNLAITYTKLGNNELALETIEKAYKQIGSIKDSTLIASIIFDYGKVLNINKRHDEALEKFFKSLEMFKALTFRPLIARSLFYIADTYTQKKEYTKAKSYFLECKIYEKYISKRSMTELNIKLGALYLGDNQVEKAKSSFLVGFETANQCDYRELKRESSTYLSKVYERIGDYQEAYKYSGIATALKDSIYDESHSKGIAELKLKYDSEKTENEIQGLKYRQTRLWFLFGGIMALAVIIVAFYIIRLSNKNNKALQLKNKQIEEQNKVLKEQNESLEQFAYAAAHDLKEPLRNIGSFANLLQRRYSHQLDENAQEYMGFIVNGAKRMNDLLVGLLNLSSLTTERANGEEVVLGDVVKVVTSNLKMAIEEKEAIINYVGHSMTIPMNQLHMIQLIQNLVGNAIKFVEERPKVIISASETDSSYQISVKDNGIGMDKAYENKVFRLFQRLDKTKNYEGNGVGLSICKNIVEKYGGKIWFESELNKGTQFFINIPKSQILKAA